jgi:hypothetical protein
MQFNTIKKNDKNSAMEKNILLTDAVYPDNTTNTLKTQNIVQNMLPKTCVFIQYQKYVFRLTHQ